MPVLSRRGGLLVLLLAAAIATAVALVWSLVRASPAPWVGEQMIAVSPGGVVELVELEPGLQELYRAVADDETAFVAVRCYCGCEAMLEHRHLLDCFVRPDGQWERHAVADLHVTGNFTATA